MEPEKIKLITSDNFEISANFYGNGNKGAPAAVLAHMLPSNKESWDEFAKKLNDAGFQCLAIDLRGHGESQGGPEGSKKFTDQEHQASIEDVKAAVKFFTGKGIELGKICLVGASIGANLSLWLQFENPEVKASALLSPGLNYKGIETERFAKNLGESQAVFLVAGGENDGYSSETVFKLSHLIKSPNKKIKIFENAGHGTDIFKEESGIMDEIVEWFKGIYLPAN